MSTVTPIKNDGGALGERWLMAMAEAGYPKEIVGEAEGFATFHPPATSLHEARTMYKAYRLVGIEISEHDFFEWLVDGMDRRPKAFDGDYSEACREYLANLTEDHQ